MSWMPRRGNDANADPAREALKTALDSEGSSKKDIKAKLKAFRSAKKDKEKALDKARAELKQVLTVKQEAGLVLSGMLD